MQPGLRIAYVINSVEGGGAAFPVPRICAVLRDNGAEVRILALTRRDGRAAGPIEAAGFELRVRPGGRGDHLAALRWLDAEIADLRPTHLWTSLSRATLLGQLVGLRRGLPVVSWQHAAWLRPANRLLLRATRRLSTLWIADSQQVFELTHVRLGVPYERLVCWPIFAADPDAPRAAPWRPGEVVRVGSLGRLHPVKGYDLLIEALARLADGATPFEVVIGGDGEQRAALQSLATVRGVRNLRFAGFVEDTRGFLAGLHLYVQPSRSEGFCVGAHEAMAAGVPVLASSVGELPHSIIPGATGALVPPGDPVALAAALAGLLGRPEHLAAMGEAGRARVLERASAAAFADTGAAIVARLRGAG